jgi:hypothetical protein
LVKFVQILAEAITIIIIMYPKRASFFTATVITSLLLIICLTLTTPAMALSKGNKGGAGGGPVSQEKVSTGNSNLDKEVNTFYSCISKTHQDPPTIDKVDSCYYQALGGSGTSSDSSVIGGGSVGTTGNYITTGPGTSPTSTPISTSKHHHTKGL